MRRQVIGRCIGVPTLVLVTTVSCTISPPVPTVTATTSSSVTSSSLPTVSSATPSATSCERWGTAKEASVQPTILSELYAVQVSTPDACSEQIDFVINGVQSNPAGYSVDWTSSLSQDPSDKPISVGSGALLLVVIHAPAQGYGNSGHQPGKVLASPGARMNVSPSKVVREVWFAGSFENQSNFGVVLDRGRPHHTSTYTKDGYTHVTIQFAVA